MKALPLYSSRHFLKRSGAPWVHSTLESFWQLPCSGPFTAAPPGVQALNALIRTPSKLSPGSSRQSKRASGRQCST